MKTIPTPTQKSICIKLSDIRADAGTQIRANINTDTVDEYANDMQDVSNKFPPIVLFQHGDDYILADGFHRLMAASRNGFKDILADVYQGTREDALRFALSANGQHGLRRTTSDKRRSIDLALHQWPNLSDRELARMCAVSPSSVGSLRHELSKLDSWNREQVQRKGKDGKVRKLPKKPERQEEPERPQVRTADEILTEQAQADQEKPTKAEPKQQNNYRAGMLRSLDICIATVAEVRKLKLSDDPDVIKKLKELRMMAGAALYKQGGKA